MDDSLLLRDPWRATPGIVVNTHNSQSAPYKILYQLTDGTAHTNDCGTSIDTWIAVVHAVNTPEAQAIHAQYPQYQGRDYTWYLEQRGLLPSVVQGPLPVEEWLPGDIVERNAQGGDMRCDGTTYGDTGDRFLVSRVSGPNLYVRTLAGTVVPECWDIGYFTWIDRKSVV